VLTVLLTVLGGIPSQTAQSVRSEPTIQRYDLRVDLDPVARTLQVEVKADVEASRGEFTLYLPRHNGLVIIRAEADGVQADVRTEGHRYAFVFQGTPERTTVQISYRWTVPLSYESIRLHLGPEEGYLLAERDWFVSTEGSIWIRPPVPYHLTITLPEPLMAVSAGHLVREDHSEGKGTYEWDLPAGAGGRPFFAYGKYTALREGSVDVYVLGQGGEEGGKHLARAASEILDYYEELFSSPPEVPVKLIAVTRRGGWNGGGNCVLLNVSSFHQATFGVGWSLYQHLAHELAHTWWGGGGLVVPDQLEGYGILNEALANYAAARAIGHKYGPEAERHVFRIYREKYLPISGQDIPLAEQTPAAGGVYYNSSYNKGAWVHRMLEGIVGRELFLNTLRAFIQTYRGQAVSLEAFQQAVQQAYSDDLSWFFREWLYEVVLPVYSARIEGNIVHIINTGTGEMPVTVHLHYRDRTQEDKRVWVPSGGEGTISVQKPLNYVEIDPDEYILHK
jgi:hypothetical protein